MSCLKDKIVCKFGFAYVWNLGGEPCLCTGHGSENRVVTKTLIPTDLSIAIPKELMLVLVNLTSYLLIYVHKWFGFVSKTEFCCSSTQIGIGMEALDWCECWCHRCWLLRPCWDYHSNVDFEVKVGDRIVQLILEKIVTPDAMKFEDFDAIVRGVGGFGSTGVWVFCDL